MTLVLFTVIDLETAGLAPPASIVEVGFTHLHFDTETKVAEVLRPQTRLFKPSEPLTPENVAVHHLTNAMLDDCRACTDDDLREIVELDRPQFLVAAHSAFEQQWLTPAITGDLRWICTVKAASRIFPEAESSSNQATRYRLGLDLPDDLAMPPHRAGPDSFVTAHILSRFLSTTRVRDLVQWTLEPRFLARCPFGKHKGAAWDQIPADYLDWMLKQVDMDGDAKHAAALELERRRSGVKLNTQSNSTATSTPVAEEDAPGFPGRATGASSDIEGAA